jgi:hypothetical protein
MARSAVDRHDRQRRHRRWVWSAGPPEDFLDDRTDVAAAYSLRLVRSNYSGPLVRLRRASDNAELDFYSGVILNFSDVSGWAGGDAFATTFYDQSGLARHLTQAAASAQPKIIQASNGRPALLFDGSNDYLRSATFTLNQAWSFNLCYRLVAAAVSFPYIFDGTGNDTCSLFINNSSPLGNTMAAGSSLGTDNGVSMPTGTRGVVAGVFNGASSRMEINAAAINSFTGNVGAANAGQVTLGAAGGLGGSNFANIEVQEHIAFSTVHTSAQLKADNAAMRAAWGF